MLVKGRKRGSCEEFQAKENVSRKNLVRMKELAKWRGHSKEQCGCLVMKKQVTGRRSHWSSALTINYREALSKMTKHVCKRDSFDYSLKNTVVR